jgi:hypothetical protein
MRGRMFQRCNRIAWLAQPMLSILLHRQESGAPAVQPHRPILHGDLCASMREYTDFPQSLVPKGFTISSNLLRAAL